MFRMFPFKSATAVYGPWVSLKGTSCKLNVTVSPGCQPEPVMVATLPGA